MKPKIIAYDVDSVDTMEWMITTAIRDGWTVANKSSTRASLLKQRYEPDLVTAVLFVVFIIPMILYTIVDALSRDQILEIMVNPDLVTSGERMVERPVPHS